MCAIAHSGTFFGCIFLVKWGARTDQIVGFVVDSGCSYFRLITFPDRVHVGARVVKLGNSSVQYELALFCDADERPAAVGDFVHVYVDRGSN